MEHKDNEAIVNDADADALADGVVVSVDVPPVNRVTRAAFDHFVRRLGDPIAGPCVMDVMPLTEAIKAMLALRPEPDERLVGTYKGKELWLVPNDVGGLTLMFPEDFPRIIDDW